MKSASGVFYFDIQLRGKNAVFVWRTAVQISSLGDNREKETNRNVFSVGDNKKP